MNVERGLRLLAARGAADVEHPGGSLADHLARVGAELARLGAAQHVIAAGCAHAAYGTAGFPVALLDHDRERPLLRAEIGDRAESLVHRYGSWDRSGWAAIAEHRSVTDRFTGARTALDDDELRDLLDLSAVNELDVLGHAGPAGRARAELVELLRGWAPACSPRVAAVITDVLTGRRR